MVHTEYSMIITLGAKPSYSVNYLPRFADVGQNINKLMKFSYCTPKDFLVNSFRRISDAYHMLIILAISFSNSQNIPSLNFVSDIFGLRLRKGITVTI